MISSLMERVNVMLEFLDLTADDVALREKQIDQIYKVRLRLPAILLLFILFVASSLIASSHAHHITSHHFTSHRILLQHRPPRTYDHPLPFLSFAKKSSEQFP